MTCKTCSLSPCSVACPQGYTSDQGRPCSTADLPPQQDQLFEVAPSFLAITCPPQPRWAFSLSPDFAVSFHVPHAPSWLHRVLQRALLGIRWKELAK